MTPIQKRPGLSVVIVLICFWFLSGPGWADEAPGQRFEQLSGLSAGQYDMTVHGPTGNISFLRLKQPEKGAQNAYAAGARNAEDAARSFFDRYGELFGIRDHALELTMKKQKFGVNGNQFVRFRQHRGGVPVFGGDLIVQVNSAMQAVAVSGKASSKQVQSLSPRLSAEDARQRAIGMVSKHFKTETALLTATVPELWVYNPALIKKAVDGESLVWRTEISSSSIANPIRELVLIDALNGRILLHYNQIQDAKNRTIYDNNNTSSYGLPGYGPVLTEGGTVTNDDVGKAYTYAGYTYDFYWTYHNRDSLDGAGMTLISTVRYCDPDTSVPCPYANAFWSGSQMVYGQGYASALDVVGHEMTHAVTEHESNLFYYMQSGAMNESLSDIWGELIQQTYESVLPANRWLLGENLPGGAIRSMKNPPSYDDPDKISSTNYYCGSGDNGGVHWNSGVGNKAAYLMVDGDTFNSKTISGLGITKTAKIYYEAQTNLLTEASDYQVLYNVLQTACLNLLGTSGITLADCQQVKNVVDAVEMSQQPSACPAVEAPVCSTGLPQYIFNENFENGLLNWSHGTLNSGYDAWMLSDPSVWYSTYATSGTRNAYGDDGYYSNDSYLAMASSVSIPANAYLHFNHAYDFDAPDYDGGVIEYSMNGGASWQDAGSLFINNSYSGIISIGHNNTLQARPAFIGSSNGYGSSRLNLSSLNGQNIRFRFRMGTSDDIFSGWGWWIDDVQIYTCTCAPQPVTIGGTSSYYPTIQGAYNDATNGQSVQMQSSELTGDLSLAKSIYVFLEGGYGCDFSSNPDWTTIHGKVTISGGTVFVENVVIQ